MPSLYGINFSDTFIYQGREESIIKDLLFTVEDFECGKRFISDTSKLINLPVKEYRWDVFVDGTAISYGTNNKEFTYAWPYPSEFKITHRVIDSKNNLISTNQTFDIDSCPGYGGGGGIDIRWRDKIPPKIIKGNINIGIAFIKSLIISLLEICFSLG